MTANRKYFVVGLPFGVAYGDEVLLAGPYEYTETAHEVASLLVAHKVAGIASVYEADEMAEVLRIMREVQ